MNGLVVSVYVCLLVRRPSVMCVEGGLRKGRGDGGHCSRGRSQDAIIYRLNTNKLQLNLNVTITNQT